MYDYSNPCGALSDSFLFKPVKAAHDLLHFPEIRFSLPQARKPGIRGSRKRGRNHTKAEAMAAARCHWYQRVTSVY